MNRSIVFFASALISTLVFSGMIYRWVNQPVKPPRGTPLHRVICRAFGMPLPPNKAPEYFDDPVVSDFCEFIEIGDLEAVDRIAATDIDINYVGKHGLTPLTWSFLHRHRDMCLRLMEHGADPNIRVSDDIQLYLPVLKAGDSFLLGTARSGNLVALWQTLPFAEDINQQDAWGHGILSFYIVNSLIFHKPDSLPSLLDDLDDLLSYGVDLNARNHAGYTPLHVAIEKYLDFAIPLLKRGADPLLPNDKGETAIDLFLAEVSKWRVSDTSTTIFELLQEQGYFDEDLTLAGVIREYRSGR